MRLEECEKERRGATWVRGGAQITNGLAMDPRRVTDGGEGRTEKGPQNTGKGWHAGNPGGPKIASEAGIGRKRQEVERVRFVESQIMKPADGKKGKRPKREQNP